MHLTFAKILSVLPIFQNKLWSFTIKFGEQICKNVLKHFYSRTDLRLKKTLSSAHKLNSLFKMAWLTLKKVIYSSELDFRLHAIFRFSMAKNSSLETQLWIFYVCRAAPKKDWLGSFSIAFFHSQQPFTETMTKENCLQNWSYLCLSCDYFDSKESYGIFFEEFKSSFSLFLMAIKRTIDTLFELSSSGTAKFS